MRALVLALMATLSVSSASAANCAFHYSKSIRDSIVIPGLKQKFGDAFRFFEYDHPVVYSRSGNINISLIATRQPNGQELLFEDHFVIVVDPCAKIVIRSYVTQNYHKE